MSELIPSKGQMVHERSNGPRNLDWTSITHFLKFQSLSNSSFGWSFWINNTIHKTSQELIHKLTLLFRIFCEVSEVHNTAFTICDEMHFVNATTTQPPSNTSKRYDRPANIRVANWKKTILHAKTVHQL